MTTTPFADQPPASIPYDLAPADLRTWLPDRVEPEDFDGFWKTTLASCYAPAAPVATRVDIGLRLVDAYDVTFAGFGGDPVRAWLVRPTGDAVVPCVVQYVGYGGGRGALVEHLVWAAAGYAHLVMDARGQGSDTPDRSVGSSLPAVVSGLRAREEYYYRRFFVDAVAAVEAARGLPGIDPERVAVAGASQGGGTALVAAALVPTVSAVLCDVPFLCDWSRAVRLADRGPYTEVARYCAQHRQPVDQVFTTLSYFDAVNFASRCRQPALFSAALADRVCPPSTVYAAYNHYAGPKQIVDWEFNDHEGGGADQVLRQLEFLRRHWTPATAKPRQRTGTSPYGAVSPSRGRAGRGPRGGR
jgi:cephalosporin-C deacetylase